MSTMTSTTNVPIVCRRAPAAIAGAVLLALSTSLPLHASSRSDSFSRALAAGETAAGAAAAGGSAGLGPGAKDLVVLPNGLRVLFLEAHSNPMVASTVAVLSG